MKIDDFPPGLISRRAIFVDMNRVVISEHWDISVPGCPMIKSPWSNDFQEGSHYIRQVTMTAEEYAEARPPLTRDDRK